MKPIKLIGLILVFFGCWSPDLLAQRKTDIVTLYNGDRITGEIKSLSGGILRLSTDAMGTLNIEWQEIAHLESEFYYEVRLGEGTRYFGSIEKSERPGEFHLLDLDGEHALEWLKVVEMRPIEKTFLERLDLYFAAGFSYNRASSVAQTTINTTIDYETEKSRNSLTGRVTFTDAEDESTSSSKLDLNRAVWTKRQNVFRALFGSYESNDELALDHRVGAGWGLGRYLLDNYKSRWAGIAGLQVITEQSKITGSDQNLELYLSSRFRAWHFDTPELDLDFGLSVYPSLTDSGRIRSSSDLRLRWELVKDLFFDITAYGSYDNRADANNGVDYGVTTGLGWELK